MKRLNYTLEKTAEGWVLKSETGENTNEFKSTEGGLDVLIELLNSKAITLSSAKDLLEKISDQEVLPLLNDENNQGLRRVIDSINIAKNVQHITGRLKWSILFDGVEAPALVMCTCGGHARIKLDEDRSYGEILSKEDGKNLLKQFFDEKIISDEGGKKLLQQINDSNLPETEEKDEEELFPNSFPFPFPDSSEFPGGVMVISVRVGQKN